MHTDPLLDQPGRGAWAQALDKATTVIAHASYLTEGIAEHATVVFPAESYAEQEGTVTHPDGRLQRLRRSIGRPGDTLPEWQVLATLMKRLGTDLGVLTSSMVTRRMTEDVPFYAGITLDDIGGRGAALDRARAGGGAPRRRAGARSRSPSRPPRRPRNGRLRLGSFRSIWAAPEVGVAPALKFLHPRQRVELSRGRRAAARRRSRRPRQRRLAATRASAARSHVRAAAPEGSVFLETAIGARQRERARRPARRGDASMSAPLAVVGYAEPWWMMILKSLVIFAIGLQLVPIVLLMERKILGRFQNRYGPNRVGPFGADDAAGRHRQAADQGAVPPAHVDRLALQARADPLDHRRRRRAGDHPVRQRPGHLRHADRASTGSTSASARSTSSRSARSPSTGSCSAAGRRARSTRSSARCAPPRS